MPPKTAKKTTTSRGGSQNYKSNPSRGKTTTSKTTTKKQTTHIVRTKKVIGISGYGCQSDVIFAIVLLKNTKDYKYADIKLLFNKEDMKGCNIVLGYGGKYDPEQNLFDYHQRGYKQYFDETKHNKITMTASSMVFKKYSKEIIMNSISQFLIQRFELHSITDELIGLVKEFFYELYLEGIDAVLNGYDIFEQDATHPLLYFNPTESHCTIPDYCHTLNDVHVAIETIKSVFHSAFENTLESAVKYNKLKTICSNALKEDNPYRRRIVLCDTKIESYPVLKVEKALKCEGNFLFFIREYKGIYTCRSISQSHLNERALFPVEWRGKENEELQKIVGDSSVTFCHQSGFLLQCTSLDCALNLVLKAIELHSSH